MLAEAWLILLPDVLSSKWSLPIPNFGNRMVLEKPEAYNK